MSGPHNPSIEAHNVPPPSWTDYEKSFVSQSHADCSSSRLTTPNTDMSTTPIQRGEEERRSSKQEDYGQGQGQPGSLENDNGNSGGDAALAQQLGPKKIVVIMTALCVCLSGLVWSGLDMGRKYTQEDIMANRILSHFSWLYFWQRWIWYVPS